MKSIFALIMLSVMITGCSKNPFKASVSVVNMEQNSGGSGTILESEAGKSLILTNRHVCEVVSTGGKVVTDDGTAHMVVAYVESELHDLCLVQVAENLHVNQHISLFPPSEYEEAVIIGHPALLPTTPSHGVFSKKTIITVMQGIRKCTDSEKQDPALGFICMLLGGMPDLVTREALYVSALIMPGSSGSPIYDSSGDIAAVAFAGTSGLSYGYAVPHEFLAAFLSGELPNLKWQKPDNHREFISRKASARDINIVREVCDLLNMENSICSYFKANDMIFSN